MHFSLDGSLEETRHALGTHVNLFKHIIWYDWRDDDSNTAATDRLADIFLRVGKQWTCTWCPLSARSTNHWWRHHITWVISSTLLYCSTKTYRTDIFILKSLDIDVHVKQSNDITYLFVKHCKLWSLYVTWTLSYYRSVMFYIYYVNNNACIFLPLICIMYSYIEWYYCRLLYPVSQTWQIYRVT